MYFSQNISTLCNRKGWRTADLARALKISPQQAGRYINGRNQPKFETAIEIAELFDVNLDDLILKNLSQEAGRPFGAEGEDVATPSEAMERINKLQHLRIAELEREIKRNDPGLARELGID